MCPFTSAAAMKWRGITPPAHVDLVADKKEYKPGDTARLLVKAPISGDALVTIERGGRILRRMRVTLEGNAQELEAPLDVADAPNVFVSLMLIRGREDSPLKHKMPSARYGLAMLRVRQPDEQLNVEVKPAKPEVLPGGEVEVDVLVRNEDGKAVAGAEVVLFAPDDGILAITGYERPKPGPIFHQPFPLAIRTGLSLFDLMPEDPAALEFSNKGYLIGGGGDGAGPGLKVRRDFPGPPHGFRNSEPTRLASLGSNSTHPTRSPAIESSRWRMRVPKDSDRRSRHSRSNSR